MKKLCFSFIVFLSFFAAQAQQPVIVSPQWLHDNLSDPDLVILYTGFVIKADFDREHIEGSRFLWADWLAPSTPEATMNAVDVQTATKRLQDLGINKNSKIVLCHKGADVTITSRMFCSLEYFGLQGKVSYLNGGIEAWKKAGYAVSNKPPVYKKGNYVAGINPVLVNKDYVLNALNTGSQLVVDARMKRWYDGDVTGNPRDGHISGALNIPYPDMVDSTNSIKPTAVLEKNFTTVAPDKSREIVLYCFIGQTACVDYVVGRSLGYNMKVYDGSMQEWSRDEKLPMEKTKKDK
ncbi:MAG TPA: rhodanese-like domain-containing protein [Ferruginibacter sp.]|nr:rhodanese-like domain-containing protein [Ferruginibacter sp.]